MRFLVCLGLLVACGKVDGKDPADAPGGSEGGSCPDPTSVTSCGAACVQCPGGGEREVATCDGTACGLGCVANAPRCTDNSCSQLGFDFTSNTLEGITVRAPANLQLEVRNHGGNLALAIPVTNLNTIGEVSFVVPICLSGAIDIVQRQLSASIVFEDPNAPSGEQFFVQASVPDPKNGAFLNQFGVVANTTFIYVSPLTGSQFSNAATTVTFQAGTFGANFTGTIWFDDIAIQ